MTTPLDPLGLRALDSFRLRRQDMAPKSRARWAEEIVQRRNWHSNRQTYSNGAPSTEPRAESDNYIGFVLLF